jgi:hypothetical protein
MHTYAVIVHRSMHAATGSSAAEKTESDIRDCHEVSGKHFVDKRATSAVVSAVLSLISCCVHRRRGILTTCDFLL